MNLTLRLPRPLCFVIAQYMVFHNRRLFAPRFAPAPFVFAVRRSVSHSPEGTLSIEQAGTTVRRSGAAAATSMGQPIATLCATAAGAAAPPMTFALSAATTVAFGGERHLHAWLDHRFGGDDATSASPPLTLAVRARQFSSMIVLVGKIASASEFVPTHAAVVSNKDELKVPLAMSTLPTPGEFRDAIESLSPTQQRFAKAFRAMQLSSTLFGILVLQVKPQLERCLNLPDDSLTKQIRLTQQLMELFTKCVSSRDDSRGLPR